MFQYIVVKIGIYGIIVALSETGSKNSYVKETEYIKQHTSKSSSTKNITISPMWWADYFGLYTKEKNDVSHSNIYFGSDNMTLDKNRQSHLVN